MLKISIFIIVHIERIRYEENSRPFCQPYWLRWYYYWSVHAISLKNLIKWTEVHLSSWNKADCVIVKINNAIVLRQSHFLEIKMMQKTAKHKK